MKGIRLKKSCVMYILLIVLLSLISACSSFNSENINDSGYTAVKSDTGYYKIFDYNKRKVKEIHTGMSDSDFRENVPVSDGFYVRQWIKKDDAGGETHSDSKIMVPVLKRYDKYAALLWTKTYDIPGMNGGACSLAEYPDGGFILAIERWPFSDKNHTVYPESFVLRCDKNGKIIWKKSVENFSGAMLSNLVVTEKGEIITVGTWMYKDGKQVKAGVDSDLVFMKFSPDGDVLLQKNFGENGNESLPKALYSDDTGLVVYYYVSADSKPTNKLVCFNKDFDEKWKYVFDEKEYPTSYQLFISGGFIYQAGVKISGAAGEKQEYFFMKFDKEGNIIWRDRSMSRSITAVTLLNGGNIAIAGTEGKNNYIDIINTDNIKLYSITDRKCTATSLYPLDDGGLTAVSVRNIKTVPQPVFASFIWYDTETVASRYGRDLTLVWRKTYDKYKGIMKTDFVYPAKDGNLLVE